MQRQADAVPAPHNFERIGKPLINWPDLDRFLNSQNLADAAHVIDLAHGQHLDVLINGDLTALPAGRSIPVFFSAAIAAREEKLPPFFAGTELGAALGMPTVSVSDPLLEHPNGLNIAWHTGGGGTASQDVITQVLRSISARAGRDLLLIGGSAGGFAALAYADRLGDIASAFVWNPQTEILDYIPESVNDYLMAAVPEHGQPNRDDPGWQDRYAEILQSAGIQHNLRSLPESGGPRRLLYLQNAGDWHLGKHMAPYLDARGYSAESTGRFAEGDTRTVAVSRLSDGHNAPPWQTLRRCIELMADDSTVPGEALDRLQREGLIPADDLETLPTDLRDRSDDIRERFRTAVVRTPNGVITAWAALDGLARRHGGLQVTFAFQGDGEPVLRMSPGLRVQIDDQERTVRTVDLMVLDGLGHHLFSVTEEVTERPQAPTQPAEQVEAAAPDEPPAQEPEPVVTLRLTGSGELTATIFAPGATHVAFHLMRGAEKVQVLPYGQKTTHAFNGVEPGIYLVRAFAMTADGERIPCTSEYVRVS